MQTLENWMWKPRNQTGKKRSNPIDIYNTLRYEQDEGFILFNMLSFSSAQNSDTLLQAHFFNFDYLPVQYTEEYLPHMWWTLVKLSHS